MYKRIISALLLLAIAIPITACSSAKEMTLNFSFGERTGKYEGDLVDGVPNGQGKFTTENELGESWTYEGSFVDGHFQGEGVTTFENGSIQKGTYENDELIPVSETEFKKLFSDSSALRNNKVKFVGKVFVQPEYTSDLVGLQVYADPSKNDLPIIVYIYDTGFEVGIDDYVEIEGLVGEDFEGQNGFGATMTWPTVTATKYSRLSYMDAVAPTVKLLEINETQDQYGYKVTLQKVEFSDVETRVYLKVENNGSSEIYFSEYDSAIIQDGKQYEPEWNYDADYQRLEFSNLYAGSYAEGIVVFPKINIADFRLVIDVYGGDWTEEITPYTFEVKVN